MRFLSKLTTRDEGNYNDSIMAAKKKNCYRNSQIRFFIKSFNALNTNPTKWPNRLKQFVGIHKDIFACLFSIHNIISLSCHEQVCLSGHLNSSVFECV